MGWESNRMGDFCPIVECGGDKSKCDLIAYRTSKKQKP